jgi:hypothetical protein
MSIASNIKLKGTWSNGKALRPPWQRGYSGALPYNCRNRVGEMRVRVSLCPILLFCIAVRGEVRSKKARVLRNAPLV